VLQHLDGLIYFMAKVKVVFCSDSSDSEFQCFWNINNKIFISIEEPNNDWGFQSIEIDKYTAIELLKHLKKEINKIEDNG